MSKDINQDKRIALEPRIAWVIDEDNRGEALTACSPYPQLPDRRLSHFEDDVRDWGMLYGIAYGLARADADYGDWDDPNELVAERAYKVARTSFAKWSGDIEGPTVVRERVSRRVIAEFEEATDRAAKAARWGKTEELMTNELRNALSGFRDRDGRAGVIRGQVTAATMPAKHADAIREAPRRNRHGLRRLRRRLRRRNRRTTRRAIATAAALADLLRPADGDTDVVTPAMLMGAAGVRKSSAPAAPGLAYWAYQLRGHRRCLGGRPSRPHERNG